MEKLPDEVLALIHSRVEKRPCNNDGNFNYIHQEDVFVIADLAYQKGKECTTQPVVTVHSNIQACIVAEFHTILAKCRQYMWSNEQHVMDQVASYISQQL